MKVVTVVYFLVSPAWMKLIQNIFPKFYSTWLTDLKSVGDEASFNLLLEADPDIIPIIKD